VAGGAIMPDGQVGLIADVAGLVELAHSEGGRGEGAGPQPAIDPELPNGPDPGLRGLTGKTAEVQS
jgi:chemotaxis protein histidine kinase CheA